jgi:hypothetical protein
MTLNTLAFIVVHDPVALMVVLAGAILALAAVFIIIAAVGGSSAGYRNSYDVKRYEPDDTQYSSTADRTQDAADAGPSALDHSGSPAPIRRYRIDQYGRIHEE